MRAENTAFADPSPAVNRVGTIARGIMISYKKYLLTVLLVIFIFNLADRVALGVLLQDIKADLDLSDTQLGLMTGIAFSLFYSVMGIPLARWADRGNRVTIVTFTTALWSAAVALCGMAGSFLQLLLVRIGVAVGEAGCVPPANSLIADYFTRDERPRAIARYMLGYPLSAVFGYFAGGWLNQLYGWRVTFIALGLPGLLLAALAWFTLKEPRRMRPVPAAGGGLPAGVIDAPADGPGIAAQPAPQPGLTQVCAVLFKNRTFRHLLLSWSVTSFFGWGITQWKPAFFIRSYGLESGEVGTWFSAIYGVGGLLGLYLGGEWATRRAPRSEDLQLKAMAIAFVFFGVISVGIYLSPNAYLAYTLLGLSLVGIYLTYGPLFGMIQTLVPPHMRAMSIALIYLFANLIGMGLGPLVAGALSDALHAQYGEQSLRYALLILSPGYWWAGWHLWWASKTVKQDLEDVR